MKKTAIDIVKEAILLEYKGKFLYKSAAEKADSKAVKGLFEMLVTEEKDHIKILENLYAKIMKGGTIDFSDMDRTDSPAEKVIREEIIKEISAAGYESAVISAGIDFEKRAVEFYGKHAKDAESENERKIYKWLVDFERGHLEMLAGIEEELREKIWADNSFWPF